MDTVFLAVYDKARAIVGQLNQFCQTIVEIRTFTSTTFTDIGTQVCIGIMLIFEDALAVRTENPFGIVVSQLGWSFFQVKTKILYRVWNSWLVEKWTVSVKENSSSWNFSNGIQYHVIGSIDFTETVHLVTEDISNDKKTRLDIVTDTR
ncbi:Uncharacterised protein [Streptococcus pneumoniae]|nr:Uncharacterised protein [Streptococcus pneumoniae]